MQQRKLDLTEAEFALLLQACARGAAPWGRVQALLAQMTNELTRLQPETLAAAEQYFRCAPCIFVNLIGCTCLLRGIPQGWCLLETVSLLHCSTISHLANPLAQVFLMLKPCMPDTLLGYSIPDAMLMACMV